MPSGKSGKIVLLCDDRCSCVDLGLNSFSRNEAIGKSCWIWSENPSLIILDTKPSCQRLWLCPQIAYPWPDGLGSLYEPIQ
ncbi:hypothetical protein TNCV_3159481 [Trichonephila clavipes]|nr:hypothetical protein TNCV_3159481 [Trichonephila clavipes]